MAKTKYSMYCWKDRTEITKKNVHIYSSINRTIAEEKKSEKINLENGLNKNDKKSAKRYTNKNGQCPKYWTIGESAHACATCAKKREKND